MSDLHIFRYPEATAENTNFVDAWAEILSSLPDADKKDVIVKAYNYGLAPAWIVSYMFEQFDLGGK